MANPTSDRCTPSKMQRRERIQGMPWNPPYPSWMTASNRRKWEAIKQLVVEGARGEVPNSVPFATDMAAESVPSSLEVVKHKVWRVRASDRFPGQYGHTVIGEGAVDFAPLFECLSGIGYDGFISLEDSNPEGDAGLERGLRFVRRKVAQWWRGGN